MEKLNSNDFPSPPKKNAHKPYGKHVTLRDRTTFQGRNDSSTAEEKLKTRTFASDRETLGHCTIKETLRMVK